jgi:cell division control protein 6
MGLFDNMLKGDESLFLEPLALDVDFTPSIIRFRENEQKYIAECVKPLFQNRNGKNLLINGTPGVGKTVACKHVLNELYKETQDIIPLYVNCWKLDTPYKIVLELCDKLGYRFIQNKKTDQLLKEVSKIINKKKLVLVLDECDKLTDNSILYFLLEEIYKKTLILITNDNEWLAELDDRIRSRLLPDLVEFKSYNFDELKHILRERIEIAFVRDVFSDEALDKIVEKTFEVKDVRVGLFLLKETGDVAEGKASRKVLGSFADEAISKLKFVKIKKSDDVAGILKELLDLIKDNSGMTTQKLFEMYQSKGGSHTYRTVSRKVKELAEKNLISLREFNKGAGGNSTVIEYGIKTLGEFSS